ncbi:MAG: hypothetical protein ABIQ30_11125 [Devosia sp.]
MTILLLAMTVSHFALAVLLFFGVNWIGSHAVEFGYGSTTLFEDVNENLALNFFLRALAPSVLIIAVSAFVVALGRPEWRFGIYLVAVYYYAVRAGVILFLNRQRLVSWPRFVLHAAAGIVLAVLAYHYLVIPNRSLLPDVDQMGNELWLAIIAFLYAVANKVPISGGPGARRRNDFVKVHYQRALARFGPIISGKSTDDQLTLIIYAVIVYEDYARPAAARSVERLMFWKESRTTGIMQVAGKKALTDEASVVLGAERLARSWETNAAGTSPYERLTKTIAEYNADDDYVGRVIDVMELLAKRAEPKFRVAYDKLRDWSQPTEENAAA